MDRFVVQHTCLPNFARLYFCSIIQNMPNSRQINSFEYVQYDILVLIYAVLIYAANIKRKIAHFDLPFV